MEGDVSFEHGMGIRMNKNYIGLMRNENEIILKSLNRLKNELEIAPIIIEEPIVDFNLVTNGFDDYVFILSQENIYIKSMKSGELEKIELDETIIENYKNVDFVNIHVFPTKESFEILACYRIIETEGMKRTYEYFIANLKYKERKITKFISYKLSPEIIVVNNEVDKRAIKFKDSNYHIKEMNIDKKHYGYSISVVYDHSFVEKMSSNLIEIKIPSYEFLDYMEKEKKFNEMETKYKKLMNKYKISFNDKSLRFRMKMFQVYFNKDLNNLNSPPLFGISSYDGHLNDDCREKGSLCFFNNQFEYFIMKTKDFSIMSDQDRDLAVEEMMFQVVDESNNQKG